MRYELYSFQKDEKSFYYNFEIESDDIKNLFKYVIKQNISNCDENAQLGWIYLDNNPFEYNILYLGYTVVPTERECIERIFECKIQKYLYNIEIKNIDDYEYNDFTKDYEVIEKQAFAESKKVCTKLFKFKPCVRI